MADITPSDTNNYNPAVPPSGDLLRKMGINDFVVEQLDHTFLNKDIEFFHNCVPTAENIALYISDILKNPIHELGATLHKIRLQESPNNAAEIYVDQKLTNSLKLKLENSLVSQT